jgi:hypothetical protein
MKQRGASQMMSVCPGETGKLSRMTTASSFARTMRPAPRVQKRQVPVMAAFYRLRRIAENAIRQTAPGPGRVRRHPSPARHLQAMPDCFPSSRSRSAIERVRLLSPSTRRAVNVIPLLRRRGGAMRRNGCTTARRTVPRALLQPSNPVRRCP